MSGTTKQHVIQKNFLYYIQDDGKRSERRQFVVFHTLQRARTRRTIVANFYIYKDEKERESKLQKEFTFKIEDFVTTVLVQENVSKQSLLGNSVKTRSCLSVLVCDEDRNERVISFELAENVEPSKTEDCVDRDILLNWNAKIRSNLEYKMDWPLELDKFACAKLKIESCTKGNYMLCLTSRMLAVVRLRPLSSVVCWSLHLLRKYTGQKSSLELMVEVKNNVHETFTLTVSDACSVAAAITKAVRDFSADEECQKQAQIDKCVNSIHEKKSVSNDYVVNWSSDSRPVVVRPPEPCNLPPTHVPAPSPQMNGSENKDSTRVLDSNIGRENSTIACVTPPTCPGITSSVESRQNVSYESTSASTGAVNSRDPSVSDHQPQPMGVSHTLSPQQDSAPSHSQSPTGNGELKHTGRDNLASSSSRSRENKPLPPEPTNKQNTKPIPAPRKPCDACKRILCDCLLPKGAKWRIGHTIDQVVKKHYPTPDTLKLTTHQRACLHAQLSHLAFGMTVWQILGEKIGLTFEDVQIIERFIHENNSVQSGELVLYHWQFLHNHNLSPIPCQVSELKEILEENCPSILEEVFN